MSWNAAGAVTALAVPAGDMFSGAEAVNDHETVAGFAGPAADRRHAVVWHLSQATADGIQGSG